MVLPSKARKLLVCLSKMQSMHFSKSIFPLGFSSEFFFSDARILNSWGGKKEEKDGAGGGGVARRAGVRGGCALGGWVGFLMEILTV